MWKLTANPLIPTHFEDSTIKLLNIVNSYILSVIFVYA